jgi:type II secretion system protein I
MRTLPPGRRGRRAQSGGFTLLEVILAIGILTLGMAAVMRVNQMAYRNIHSASDGLHASMVAEQTLSQLRCGLQPVENFGPIQLEQGQAFEDWQVQVIVEPTVAQELLQVRVLVGRTLEPGDRPACEVVRWLPNPDFVPITPAPTTSSSL